MTEDCHGIEQHEAKLINDEQSISEEIDKLGLKEMTRESLEYLAAKWYLELRNIESDFQSGLPSFNQIVKSKIHTYKKNKRLSKPKNIILFKPQFRGRYAQVEIVGKLSIIESERQKRSSGGKNRAASDERTKALDAIEKEFKLKPKGFFKLSERFNKFVTDMHAQYPIINNRVSITNRLSNLKNK
jgi:hypothetical protein